MAENNNTPVTSPTDNGQGAGGQGQPGNTLAAGNNGQSSGGAHNSEQKVEIDAKELDVLRTKAGRYDARNKPNREDRHERRQRRDIKSDEIDDPEVLDSLRQRDEQISQLSSENFTLKTKDQVRDILERDEYKDLPLALKKAVRNNPLGFINPGTKTVEDALFDIQDYLDDQLDADVSRGGSGAPAEIKNGEKPDGGQIPPAGGSGPKSPNPAGEVDVTGKSGSQRSVPILQGLLKNRNK
jgi:hypothetical protein